MKLMCLAATAALVLASGSALSQQPQPHREFRHDYWVPQFGAPGRHLSGASAEWAQRIDFASASGAPTSVSWSPSLRHGDIDMFPAPPMMPGSDDPLGPMPQEGNTGAALAGNIASDDRLAHLNEVLAVPEPSALLMMLAGLGAIIFVIRRRISDS